MRRFCVCSTLCFSSAPAPSSPSALEPQARPPPQRPPHLPLPAPPRSQTSVTTWPSTPPPRRGGRCRWRCPSTWGPAPRRCSSRSRPGRRARTRSATSRAGSPASRRRPVSGVALLGQGGPGHLADPAGGRGARDGALRLPRRHARQRDGLVSAGLPPVQRHESVPVRRRPRVRLPRDRQRAGARRLARGDQHEAGRTAAHLDRAQLPRSGRHAVLRRTLRFRQLDRSTAR